MASETFGLALLARMLAAGLPFPELRDLACSRLSPLTHDETVAPLPSRTARYALPATANS